MIAGYNAEGGRGVIEGLGSQLKLSKRQLEPSFGSLYFYGNTSSASYFYGVGFAESKQGIRRGDRVWQVRYAHTCLLGTELGNLACGQPIASTQRDKGSACLSIANPACDTFM